MISIFVFAAKISNSAKKIQILVIFLRRTRKLFRRKQQVSTSLMPLLVATSTSYLFSEKQS